MPINARDIIMQIDSIDDLIRDDDVADAQISLGNLKTMFTIFCGEMDVVIGYIGTNLTNMMEELNG